MACTLCQLRLEKDQLDEHIESKRKEQGLSWLSGGMVNGTDETTVITIDGTVSEYHRKEMIDLLMRIDKQ